MIIDTKFSFKDFVYPISTRRERVKVPTNCPVCEDTGNIQLNDKSYTCPECRGYTYHTVDGEIEWFWLFCAYTNGKMFEDFICMEAVEDCSQIDDEYRDDLEMALLTCVGWRVDNFKSNGYVADWMEDEE